MWNAGGMNILNIILNILLIPGMGATGAALATVIGRAAGVVVMAFFLFTKVALPRGCYADPLARIPVEE